MATASALVTINVEPTIGAVDDTATTASGTPVSIDVLANDTVNGLPATLALLANSPTLGVAPSNGTVLWNEATGQFDYTPNPGFCGVDAFTYEIESECEGPCYDLITANSQVGPEVAGSEMPELAGFVFGETEQFRLVSPGGGWSGFDYDAVADSYVYADGEMECDEEPTQMQMTWSTAGGTFRSVCVNYSNICP